MELRNNVELRGATWAALAAVTWFACVSIVYLWLYTGRLDLSGIRHSAPLTVAVVAATAAVTVTVTWLATDRALSALRRSISTARGNPDRRHGVRKVGEFAEVVTRFEREVASGHRIGSLHLRATRDHGDTALHVAARLHDRALQQVISARYMIEAGDVADGIEWLRSVEAELDALAGALAPQETFGGFPDIVARLSTLHRTDSVEVRCTVRAVSEPEPAAAAAALRAVDELVGNAVRHSGGDTVDVIVNVDGEGRSTVTVIDNGTGPVDPVGLRRGLGVRSARTHLRAVGGDLHMAAGPPVTAVVTAPTARP
jgi:signal transduction histidine kinase